MATPNQQLPTGLSQLPSITATAIRERATVKFHDEYPPPPSYTNEEDVDTREGVYPLKTGVSPLKLGQKGRRSPPPAMKPSEFFEGYPLPPLLRKILPASPSKGVNMSTFVDMQNCLRAEQPVFHAPKPFKPVDMNAFEEDEYASTMAYEEKILSIPRPVAHTRLPLPNWDEL